MYDNDALQGTPCRNWFDKIPSGNFLLKDYSLSDSLNQVRDDNIKAIIYSDRHFPA